MRIRKNVLARVLVLALLGLMTVCSTAFAGDRAAASNNQQAIKRLVGSWQGANDVGVNFLLTFNPGKTYTVTFTIPGVGAANGHGAWKRTGVDSFQSKDVAFVLNPNDGSISLVQTTQATFTVGAGNETVDIDLSVALSLPDGTPVDSFTSFATADRIKVTP